MRWFWIDRFTEFVRAERATALKAVTITEEHVDEYFTCHPVMTPTLVIEGFAQMGGLLTSLETDFRANTVLAKVARSKIHRYPRPGDLMQYQVRVESLQEDGSLITAQSRVADEILVEAEMTFAYVRRDIIDRDFFDPAGFLQMLRVFGLFDVGVDSDGNPLKIPEHLLAAEQAKLNYNGG